jgi:hypothetical protein
MSASNRPNHIYLVMDAGSPVAAFILKDEMRIYLKHVQQSAGLHVRW